MCTETVGPKDFEIYSTMQRIRANRKVAVVDDVDMENTAGSLLNRRIKDYADKMLDTVGIVEVLVPKREEEYVIKRRSLRFTQGQEDLVEGKDLVKWIPLLSDRGALQEETAARQMASATKARLNAIEEDTSALVAKQTVRERRAARLKQLLAEAQQGYDENAAAVQSVKIIARKEKRTMEM